ncbi:MAG TPA: PD-(D/E)XK nuclease family protein [Phycisphaerae bacterium]|nr:PD-(D/E)XK nuclease family protein [Phycisphaerae bacterium]HQL74731.1 PD-(D/E)XK nuclease family protein [Phycisphaerae bacterium]
MDRRLSSVPLAERIRRADRPVVLLRGPAACGKTSAILDLFRDAKPLQRLLLAPNSAAVNDLRRRLLEQSPAGVVMNPQVTTFAGLAQRVLRAAGATSRPASAFHLHLLLRGIVGELATAGKLPALRAVADTPGVIDALERAIGELKRAAFDTPDLRRALGARRGRTGDLLEVYERYQTQLQARNLHDTEGEAWLARDELRRCIEASQPPPALQNVQLLAVDGFTDFTPTQLEMLALLSRRVERVVVTLCWDQDGRHRMWHWTTRTLQKLRAALGERMEEIEVPQAILPETQGRDAPEPTPPPAAQTPAGECAGSRIAGRNACTALADVWNNVFHLDLPVATAPTGLHVIAACGRQAELTAVAGRIKRLLLAGAAPLSIAVLTRSMESYRPAIERVFAQHGIPLAAKAEPVSDVGVVRFVLDVAAMAPRFAFRTMLRVLKSSYFRPSALGAFDEQTAATAEMIVREGNVLEGLSAYADATARLAARARRGPDEDDELLLGPIACSAEDIVRAGELLQAMLELGRGVLAHPESAAQSPPSGGPALPGEVRPAAIGELVERLGLRAVAEGHDDPALVARDLRALDAMGSALDDLADWSGGTPLTLETLRQALTRVTCPRPRTESLVDVLDVLDARAVRYEHVFLLGLGEGEFPLRQSEGSLINDADRQAWAARGAALDSRNDLAAREMLLFYLALSRAQRELTLSFLEADDAGGVGAPGPFLLSACDPLGGLEACDLLRIPMGQFLPADQPPASHSQAVLAAVAGLFQPHLRAHPGALAWAARHAREQLERAGRGLWARHRRWRPDEPDSFDGRLSDPALLQHLAERFAGGEVFSASGLNSFGQCPWQYFASHLLNLRPLALPQRRLEAVTRGTFIHNVLHGVMSHLRQACGRGFVLAEVSDKQMQAALDEAFADASGDVEVRRPPFPVLWRIQQGQMRRELETYLAQVRQRAELGNRPLHFELGFALEGERGPRDEASRAGPVELDTPAGPLRMRGKIDRVDRIRFDGMEGLLVVDYKTGRLATPADIEAGRSLQLPLYALAVEKMLGEQAMGGVFHRVGPGKLKEQYFARMRYIRGRYSQVEAYEELLQSVLARVGEFLTAMREGRFDLLPTDDCPGYCPFRQVCQFSPARDELKRPSGQRPGGDDEGEDS